MKTSQLRRGFSLIETMIAMSIAVIVLGATWMVVRGVIKNDDALRGRVDMQLECSRGLKTMVELLKQSGVTDTNNNWTTALVSNSDADNEYPYVYTLGTSTTAVTPFSTPGYLPFNNFALGGYPTTHVINTCPQYANVDKFEGLGGSQGILFRIAKDSDNPDTARTTAVTKGTVVTSYGIEWGNEYHAFTVVYNTVAKYNELVHLVWNAAKTPKSRTVLATYVSRLYIEVRGFQAAPTPVWPLPANRAANSGELAITYNNAMNQPYPGPPPSPFEIRLTLCLAKATINNQDNSRSKPDRLAVVWQQANVNMRSIPH